MNDHYLRGNVENDFEIEVKLGVEPTQIAQIENVHPDGHENGDDQGE